MQLYVTVNGFYLDTGLNPRLTHGDVIAEGAADVDAAITAFNRLTTSDADFSIELVDGGGIHIIVSDLNWLDNQTGLPSPITPVSCRAYYCQWFPVSETGTNDFARFHQHVSAYIGSHSAHAGPQAITWLTGPYRLVPNA